MAWPDGTWRRIEHRERSKLAVQVKSGDYILRHLGELREHRPEGGRNNHVFR